LVVWLRALKRYPLLQQKGGGVYLGVGVYKKGPCCIKANPRWWGSEKKRVTIKIWEPGGYIRKAKKEGVEEFTKGAKNSMNLYAKKENFFRIKLKVYYPGLGTPLTPLETVSKKWQRGTT